MGAYTVGYQKNPNLDYAKIAKKCVEVIEGILEFDDQLHIMDSKDHESLRYFFQYVKKNLMLITAIDKRQRMYDSEAQRLFDRHHSEVQHFVRTQYKDRSRFKFLL